MMNTDPFSSGQAYKYSIESDSEQSDFEDPTAGDAPRPHQTFSKHHGNIEFISSTLSTSLSTSTIIPQGHLFVLVGAAGEFWEQGLDYTNNNNNSNKSGEPPIKPVGYFKIQHDASADNHHNDFIIASITINTLNNQTFAFLTPSIALDSLSTLSQELLNLVQPKHVTIIDSYSPYNYFHPVNSSTTPTDLDSSPLRFLATSSFDDINTVSGIVNLQEHQPPNLVEGVTASLMSLCEEQQVPSILFLLPSLSPQYTSVSLSYNTQLYRLSTNDFAMPIALNSLQQAGTALKWNSFGWSLPSLTSGLPNKSTFGFSFIQQTNYNNSRRNDIISEGMYS